MAVFNVTQIILIILKLAGLVNWEWLFVFTPLLTYIVMYWILIIHDYIRR